MLIPTVIEKTNGGERAFDIFSRMHKDRIIFMHSDVNDHMAAIIQAQLLMLSSDDPQSDIFLYINSPGGAVTAGLAIYDTMNYIPNDIVTVCTGQAASMGAFLLSSGTKGKRIALPNSRIMIHQPLGGAQGQATDIEIQAAEILRLKQSLTEILAKNCDKDYAEVRKDCERDYFMSSQEAADYGLIDRVVTKMNENTPQSHRGGSLGH